jgi:hypothetical protein
MKDSCFLFLLLLIDVFFFIREGEMSLFTRGHPGFFVGCFRVLLIGFASD